MKFRPFHKIWVYIRAMAIQDAREKRIINENIKTWNRLNRKFVREFDRMEAKRIEKIGTRTWSYTPGIGVEWSDGEIQQLYNMTDD